MGEGVRIDAVEPDSPAAVAGFAEGDVLVKTRGVAAFRLHLAPPIWSPGEKLTVLVNGKTAYEAVPEADVTGMLAAAVRGGPLAPVPFVTLRLVP